MTDRFQRADLWLLLLAIAGGAIFFSSLHHLWPLAEIDLNARPATVVPQARAFLAKQGIDVASHDAASRLVVDDDALDYLLRTFGQEQTQRLIRAGKPIYLYEIFFKRFGDPDSVWVTLHPEAGVTGWGRTVQEDAEGATVEANAARRTANDVIAAAVGVKLGELDERGEYLRERPKRRDHLFVYEGWLSREPELRERMNVSVSGAEVSSVTRELVVPESARRDARRREAPMIALQMASFILLGIAGFAALVVFLKSLQQGDVRLRRAAGWVGLISLFFLITQALRPADLLVRWDPLWPRWIANFQTLGFALAQGAWIAFALFIVIAAGDALDRRSGAERGASFWRAGSGHLFDRAVGMASLRGFMIGLICGGALVGTLLLLEVTAGAWSGIQPQGFFFFAINSSAPAISTLLYFLMVALVEELGYRFFAGTWLLGVTRRKWIAIAVPAILYGASHTGLDFLPPVEPFWGRAIALSVVGTIWGWAFFRYDALTVVLSHFTADLFIFNWPRLGSGDPALVTQAVFTIAAPLVPALFLLRRRASSPVVT
jgi:hypothetical protein